MKAALLPLVLALLLPAAALGGHTSTSSRSKNCMYLRSEMGPLAFGRMFVSFGHCVSKLTPVELQRSTSAAATCRAEQLDPGFAAAHDGKSFATVYAGAHPFAICVLDVARPPVAAPPPAQPVNGGSPATTTTTPADRCGGTTTGPGKAAAMCPMAAPAG